jgi:hypothetical protein
MRTGMFGTEALSVALLVQLMDIVKLTVFYISVKLVEKWWKKRKHLDC